MKVIYFNGKEKIDENIISALKQLNHKVVEVNTFDFEEKGDVFLFRNSIIPATNFVEFFQKMAELQALLKRLKCKKALWFTDKIVGLGNDFIENVIPLVDKVFANDDTWIRRHDYNITPLHLACGKATEGKYRKEYDVDIAFNGLIYPPTVIWLNGLKQIYCHKFKAFNVSGNDFADLCASAKVMVFPRFPNEDFYWDEKIYEIINAGGFIVYPRLYGMDLEDKKHYASYDSMAEMVDAINWFLSHKSEKELMVKQGKETVRKDFTYINRLKELFKNI
jgi:hypothetical protein